MAVYLLDTNHLSPITTPGHRLRERILQHMEIGDAFSIAVPTLTEMLYGIRVIPRARQNLIEWQYFQDAFGYYEIDRSDAEKASDIQVELRHRGWQLNTVDALIATIALRYNLILLTTDQDFRSVPGLVVENWLAK